MFFLELPQEVLKFNDICMSWSSPKTDQETNLLNLENPDLHVILPSAQSFCSPSNLWLPMLHILYSNYLILIGNCILFVVVRCLSNINLINLDKFLEMSKTDINL